MKTIIIYGSTLGNTGSAAEKIHAFFEDSVLLPVSSESIGQISGFDLVILGTSTWGYGELQDDWDSNLNELMKANFSGKKAALFGMGDQTGYSDTFLDGMGILYETLESMGAQIIGKWSCDGYSFSNSRAVVEGEFVGLALDEDNESSKTAERISRWVDLVKEKFAQ